MSENKAGGEKETKKSGGAKKAEWLLGYTSEVSECGVMDEAWRY